MHILNSNSISFTRKPVDVLKYVVDGLTTGVNYIVQVKAVNSVGSGEAAQTPLTKCKEPDGTGKVSLVFNFYQRSNNESIVLTRHCDEINPFNC